jgi:transcriptional regulator with XRE-family HTH domain
MKIIGGVNMDYQKVGLLISTLRKEKGLTQKELADKLGITDRAVSKWERGLGCPDVSLLDDLSRILDVSILEILKGRRLDKDEIVNNKSVVESMNYSKESIKYKIKKIFNNVAIGLISIIVFILVFSNLKSIYFLNENYSAPLSDQAAGDLFSEVETNIKIVKNNQGIYSDDDYSKILNFVNKLEKNLNSQNNLYYYSKDYYTYAEIIDFYRLHQDYLYLSMTLDFKDTIYEMVHRYNPSIVSNMISYYEFCKLLAGYNEGIYKQLENPYYNNQGISNDVVSDVKGFIFYEYFRDRLLLNDIIEVGEMNE